METTQLQRRGGATLWFALSLVIMAIAAPAGAQEGWQSPLLIPAAEFENSGIFPFEDNFYDSDGYVSGSTNTNLTMVAPVHLPNFATITRFEAAMVDIGDCPAVPDVQVQLRRVNYGTGDDSLLAMVNSNDNMNMEIFADTSIADATVNNLSHGYFAVVYMCGAFQGFQGVRIHYSE
jgi:hypothetical protein